MLNSPSFNFCDYSIYSNLVGIAFDLIQKIRFWGRLYFVGNTKLSLTLHNLFPRDYLGLLHTVHTVILIQRDVVEMTVVLEQLRSTEILHLCVELHNHCIFTFSTWFNFVCNHSVTSPTRRFSLTLGKLRSVTASRLYFNQALLFFMPRTKQKRLKRLVEVVTKSLIIDDFVFNINTHAVSITYSMLSVDNFSRLIQELT